MFDEAYCDGMTLGLPEVSLMALDSLGGLLASLRRTRTRAARFSSRKVKEKRGAAKKRSGLGATGARSESPAVPAAGGQGHAGANRRSGRSASGGYRSATSREADRERGRG
jgi:hypothetical protein